MGHLDELADGANGFGFRTMTVKNATNTAVLERSGKVWGPYLPPEKFRIEQGNKRDLLDRYDLPIQYFVRWVAPTTGTALFNTPAGNPSTNKTVNSAYDHAAGDPEAAIYLRKALGDDDLNDLIGAGETLKEAPPYLLLSIGAKKKYTAVDSAGIAPS